ncbi:Presenilin-like protein At1g08700 [Linum perenne]
MESSILESIGVEIIGVMSPVSICMLLVVLIVYSLSPADPFTAAASPPIRTAANLVYLESPSDSTAQKLEGSLLNALVFVVLIAVVTFLLVLLYYYDCTCFLKNYMRFSAFFVLGNLFSLYRLVIRAGMDRILGYDAKTKTCKYQVDIRDGTAAILKGLNEYVEKDDCIKLVIKLSDVDF